MLLLDEQVDFLKADLELVMYSLWKYWLRKEGNLIWWEFIYLAFIDYDKGFDRVNISILRDIMCKRGYPKHLVDGIKRLYYCTRIVLSVGKDLTEKEGSGEILP